MVEVSVWEHEMEQVSAPTPTHFHSADSGDFLNMLQRFKINDYDLTSVAKCVHVFCIERFIETLPRFRWYEAVKQKQREKYKIISDRVENVILRAQMNLLQHEP